MIDTYPKFINGIVVYSAQEEGQLQADIAAGLVDSGENVQPIIDPTQQPPPVTIVQIDSSK